MKKYIIIHGPKIRWRINTSSPNYLKMKSVDSVHLLNPYWYWNSYNNHRCIENKQEILIDNHCQFVTNGIIIRNTQNAINDENLDVFLTKLADFLKYLRYSSEQYDMKTENSIYSIYFFDKITKGIKTDINPITQMMIRSSVYNSMVTWSDLKEAEKLHLKNFSIPISENVLLDAIEGKFNHEYRKAILYSTIAIESFLARLYDKKYSILKNKQSGKNRYRLITQNEAIKDPIYNSLKERTDFKKLLHELPLYLFNKSLLVTDEQLYADTLKLYTTRNKIVHWGEPLNNNNQNQTLEISEIGASLAVQIALKIFSWMGQEKYNKFDDNEFIEIKNGT